MVNFISEANYIVGNGLLIHPKLVITTTQVISDDDNRKTRKKIFLHDENSKWYTGKINTAPSALWLSHPESGLVLIEIKNDCKNEPFG